MNKQHFFIAVEGADGSGKSTFVRWLSDEMTAANLPHVSTREPGGTPIAEELRRIALVKRDDDDLCPQAAAATMLAARIQHAYKLIAPSLREGRSVITDRYYPSTYVIQGLVGGDFDFVHRLHQAIKLPQPDLIIYLRVSAETAIERLAERNGSDNDRFKDADTVRNVCAAWDTYFQQLHHLFHPGVDVLTLDASYGKEELYAILKDQDLLGQIRREVASKG